MTCVHVVGAGAFGTALAETLARSGRDVTLSGRGVQPPVDAEDAVLIAVPAAATGSVLSGIVIPGGACVVACAKGIVDDALQTDIIARYHTGPVAVLTGPSFAEEIARGLPTALTLACAENAVGGRMQAMLSTSVLRLYLSRDPIGAQVGGALKNVTAIACGAAVGAGLGESARAALMTRGFAEMVRLGTALGAQARTFAGLSGLGDLALTCASTKSRNFAAGLALARDGRLPEGVTMEGVGTARAVLAMAARHGVDMPIAAATAAVLDGHTSVAEAMEALLSRPLKPE
jgi:glycerol-3-phosphate dehydrogenase (NAD(P)+)